MFQGSSKESAVFPFVLGETSPAGSVRGLSSNGPIREFPKIRGIFFWGPYNKDPTIWGTILGSPIFGNSRTMSRGMLCKKEGGPMHVGHCAAINGTTFVALDPVHASRHHRQSFPNFKLAPSPCLALLCQRPAQLV